MLSVYRFLGAAENEGRFQTADFRLQIEGSKRPVARFQCAISNLQSEITPAGSPPEPLRTSDSLPNPRSREPRTSSTGRGRATLGRRLPVLWDLTLTGELIPDLEVVSGESFTVLLGQSSTSSQSRCTDPPRLAIASSRRIRYRYGPRGSIRGRSAMAGPNC
jgi:hypothetical protein